MHPIFHGGGEMGERMRAFAWGGSALGPAEAWAPALKALVGVILAAKQPMFVAWGPDLTMLYNDAYRALLGSKHPAALGVGFLAVWAEARQDLEPLVDQVFAGEPVHMDDITLMLDRGEAGREAHFAFSYTPVRDDDGKVVGLLCPCTETTAQVFAERRQTFRLRLEDDLHGLDDPARIMATAVGALGRHLGANRVGYGEMQADGHTVLLVSGYEEGVAPNSGAVEIDAFGQEAAARQRRGLTVLSPDIAAEPIYDAVAWAGIETRAFVSVPLVRDGRLKAILYANQREPRQWSVEEVALIEGVASRIWDAVERAQAEAALRHSEAQFSTLAQAMPNQAWTARPSGELDWFNTRTYDYSGAAPGTLDGEGWAAIVHPEDLPIAGERWAAACASGTVYEVEFRIRRHDGAFRWHIARAVPIRDAERRITRWVGTNTDIHAQKTAELDILAAKETAEAANLAKSTFIANMSHELRTPLSAIIGYSEMMLEELEDGGSADGIASDVRKVESNARHLLGLINDVLDLSKVESGKMEIYAEAFDVGVTVRDIAATVQSLVAKKRNGLDLVLAADVGTMRSDLTKVRQILLNLLGNAAKFTEDGTITLSAAREAGTDGSEWIVFRIADTGIGMSDEQIANLFQRFQQADSSTTRKFGGTGLGLSLSKAFSDMLGGNVGVVSRLGHGTTFTVSLPALHAESGEAPPAADLVAVEVAETARALVLVIDDDESQRSLMIRFLQREGFAARAAADGETGLALARALTPRAILLDVMMPGIDGWSVLSALKADPALAAIPVVMVTFVDQRGLAASLGAADYVLKPVRLDRFKAVMDRFRPSTGGILVVEDDADTRQRIRTLLYKDGWSVTEAGNGREGLDCLAVALPDVVLLDLTMPVMDGFGFLRGMRALPGCADIPVVVLTALDLSRDDRRRLAGASQILHKGDTSLRAVADRLHQLVVRAADATGP